MLGEIRDELMPEEMRIDPLGKARGARILFDDLPNTPGGVRLTAIGLKEMARAGTLLTFDILREFTAKARGKEDIPIFMPFALRDGFQAATKPKPTVRAK